MASHTVSRTLTSGRLLARNTVWNLVGQLAPAIAAVFAIPLLIRGIGLDRYGVLTLGWIVIGYFSVFDLGLGRALTKLVSDRIGTRTEDEIPPLVWSSLLLIILLSAIGACVLALLTPWLVRTALKIPAPLQNETQRVFFLLAMAVPVVTLTSGLRGVLEAQQRFGILNAIRIPLGIFTFAGPLAVLPFSHSLVPIVILLIAGRCVACLIHLLACLRFFPALRHDWRLRRGSVIPALHLGAWMTVSNVISPLMVSVDRFLIGAVVSVTAVAYYTAPFDFVIKLAVLPASLVGVLFPAFALTLGQERERTARLFSRGVKSVFLVVCPITLAILALAPEGLRLWLGDAFMVHSTLVLRWLAVGVFVSCLAHVPLALIQAAGRPDVTAKLHMIEFPLYVAGLWWAVRSHGIDGAAVAWTARVSLDAILLFVFAARMVPIPAGAPARMAAGSLLALLAFYFATLPGTLVARIALACVMGAIFAASTWYVFLAPEERALLLRFRQSAPVE